MVQLQLDESVLAQMGVQPTTDNTKHQIEFDAKGTAHLMFRDEEGALKKDSPLNEKVTIKPNSDVAEIRDEINALQKSNKRLSSIFELLVIVGVCLSFICIYVVLNL